MFQISFLLCKDQSVLLLTFFRNCTKQIFSVLMKNCQQESKHVRQKHFRFYRLAICPPSLAKTQQIEP